MKQFEEVKMTVIMFDEDIITTSDPVTGNDKETEGIYGDNGPTWISDTNT